MTTGHGRRRARFAVAGTAVVALVAAVTAFALVRAGPSPQPTGGKTTSTTTSTTNPPATSSTTTTTAPPPTTTTTTIPPPGIGHFGVQTTSFVATVPGAATTESQLDTAVWYPTTTPPRRFPLLVFSQGYAKTVASYTTLLSDWASAGFVVAAPTYPHTTPTDAASPLDETDIEHHPADLRAVLATLLTASAQPVALQGLVDAAEVGLVGQSDGGDVSLAVADNACCRIGTIKAVAVLSGAEFRGFGGAYFPPGDPSPPLLVVQGDADTINAPVCSLQIYDAAPQPKWYLNLLGATHLGPYTESTAWESAVAAVTTDFFDAELAHEPSAIAAMQVDGNVSGTAVLTNAASAPPASGTCVDAP